MTALLRIGSALIGGTLVMGGQAAHAQSCLGMPSLQSTAKVISTTGMGSGSDRLVVGRFGMNGQRVFAGVKVGYGARNDFLKPRDAAVGLDVGYAFQLGGNRGVQVCPVLESMYQQGPNHNGLREAFITTTFGISAGRTFRANSSFAVMPFVGGGVIQRHTNYAATHLLDVTAGRVASTYDKFLGSATIGLGLHLGQYLTLTPVMTAPFGAGPASPFGTGYLWGREANYSISASFRIPR